MTWIECKSSEETMRVFMIRDPIAIGRAATCELSFPQDKEVSRIHAIVELRGKHWYLADQKSTNGSFVNGQRVTVPFPIKDGDVIEIGGQLLKVVTGIDFTVKAGDGFSYSGYPHLYVILKVEQGATAEEIEAAYLALAAIFDPAARSGNEMATRLMKELEDAYAVLSDPERRAEYDGSLRAG
jgi:hypothetical protein